MFILSIFLQHINIQIMEDVFQYAEDLLVNNGFEIIGEDKTRPWGGFYVINEQQAAKFIGFFFKDMPLDSVSLSQKLSPKILIVAPHKRLSWQYHNRRSEIWKVVKGPAGVVTSFTDDENELQRLNKGDFIYLEQGQRHRLAGLESSGVIAEIWQHTDPAKPSNEEDIIRLQDDFGR